MPQNERDSIDSQMLRHAMAALIVLLSAIHLYCPPARVAELEVIPDSVEYAVAGHQFATTGRYEIRVNGQAFPPRYPPGFSVLFLAPIYAVAPGNIGNGIFAVWICGILAALFAYLIGARLGGIWGGTLAAVLLLHHRQFVDYTQVIMTDVPAVALGLAACWIFLRMQQRPVMLNYFCAGLIVALSVAIRPLSGVIVLPFLFHVIWNRSSSRIGRLALLLVPTLLVIAGTSWQQWHAFGDWRRTGYQFWLPVPYDYFPLTFSIRYLRDNLHLFQWVFLWVPAVVGVIGLCALRRKRAAEASRVAFFLIVGVLPLTIAHLFYFFTDIRFHFLTLSLLCVLGGAGVAALIPESLRRRALFVPALLALTIFLPRIGANPLEEVKPVRRKVATVADQSMAKNAVLISGIDPAYLEEIFVHGTSRKVLPIGRKTPYASAVLAPRRVARLDPPPRNAADQSCAGLLHGGAQPLYSFTADEAVGQLREWIGAGTPVYLELLSTPADDPSVELLRRSFRFVHAANLPSWLVRLEAPL